MDDGLGRGVYHTNILEKYVPCDRNQYDGVLELLYPADGISFI